MAISSNYDLLRTPLGSVVPQGSRYTAFATMIVNSTIPSGVENPINKISTKTGLHRRLHSFPYYGIVNCTIIMAYASARTKEQQSQNVYNAIIILRAFVSALNEHASF